MTLNQKHPFRALSAMVFMVLLAWGGYPPSVEATSWSFVFMGDQRGDDNTSINQPIVSAMAAQIATQNPDFVLCGGDQIHGIVPGECNVPLPTQYSDWKTAMAPILGIVYPVRGNHEAEGERMACQPQA